MTAVDTAPAPSLWRNRRFMRYWTGQTISQLGDQITVLALPLTAVVLLDASAGQVALLTALLWLPNLLALLVGAWVDRRRRKLRLMVIANLVSAAVLLTLPLTHAFGSVTMAQLMVIAFLIGACAMLFSNAASPFFAHLVPRRSYLEANSKLSSTLAGTYVAGPAVGGLLVQLLGAPVAVTADAVSFVVAAMLFARAGTHEPEPETSEHPQSVLRSAKEGLHYVLRHPILRASLGCSTTINFFTFIASSGIIVLFANRGLGLSAAAIGLSLGIGAVGSIVGAVLAPMISRRIGIGRTIAVGAVIFPAALVIAAVADGPIWVRAGALALTEFVSGVGVMLYDVNQNSLKTSIVPDGMRSRVAGAYSTINYGIRPAGALVGGVLATAFGLRPTLLIAAVGGALSVLWLLPSPIPKIWAIE